jgi:UrcA family protein
MRRLTLTILMAAQCISGQFAHADSPSQSPLHVHVHFADLDLARIDGAATLYTRLRAAARQVCAPLDEKPLERAQRFRACVADALSAAVTKIDQPLLTSYYLAQLDGRSAVYAEVAKRVTYAQPSEHASRYSDTNVR